MPDVANRRWKRRISHHHRRQVSKASTKRRKAGPTLRDVLRGGWQTERFGSGQQCNDSRGYTHAYTPTHVGGEGLGSPVFPQSNLEPDYVAEVESGAPDGQHLA